MTIRPSQMMHLSSPLVAYCFDRAVWLFGSTLENALEESTNGCKDENAMRRARLRVLDLWFPENKTAKGRFKDPMKLM